ncbi:hypothetical protein HMPREF9096_00800 [Haemophilus sp. oral taxon 851 str. F0397]|nr:hypothetical protein HMPREF9096_00800 [Haemophilus sp. oral taxon 851 str. F0397]
MRNKTRYFLNFRPRIELKGNSDQFYNAGIREKCGDFRKKFLKKKLGDLKSRPT